MTQQSLAGGELLLGIGVAAGAIWAARNPELVAAVVSGAVKTSNMEYFRVHDTEKFDDEIMNRWRNLKLSDFKRYVQVFNLTEIEQQRLLEKMTAINKNAGSKGIDETWRFLSALTSTPSLGSYSDRHTSVARRNRRAARVRTKNQSSALSCLPQLSTYDLNARETLQSISLVRNHEIEATTLQVVDALNESSYAALLRAIETKLRAEDPPLTRREVRALLKPVVNSFLQRPKPVKLKKVSRFDSWKIERLLDIWHEEITRRSGVGPDVIRRSKDRVNVEISTWTRWVKAEFPEECLKLRGDVLKEFTREVKRAVYRLNERRLGATQAS